MIRFVDSETGERQFYRLCRGTAFGCKLAAAAVAYGFDRPFARFWVDEGAAYCQLDSALAVAGFPGEPEEAAAFVSMLGPKEIFGPADFLAALGLTVKTSGPVLGKTVSGAEPEISETADIQEIYGLLRQLRMAGDWESFYLDLSHRLRHGTALAAACHAGGQLAGCGVALVTKEAALLSALAVREEFRRQGIGSQVVARLEAQIPQKKLYLFRETGKNQAFYRNLGFQEEGCWAAAHQRPAHPAKSFPPPAHPATIVFEDS